MYDHRIESLRKILREKHLDSLLVTNFYNILYLTRFKTLVSDEREAFLFVGKKDFYIFTDLRYRINNPKVHYLSHNKKLTSYLSDIIQKEQITSVGVEADDLKFSEFTWLSKTLKKVRCKPIENIVLQLREVKEKGEIDKIREACRIGDECLREVIKTVRVGQSEKEIAFKIEFWIRKKGHDISFSPIVAVDENAAIPHYDTKSGLGKLRRGSLLLIDFGVRYKDYCSDMTRMFFIGQPSQDKINIYNALRNVQKKGVEGVSRYSRAKELDSYVRRSIEKDRLSNFTHSTGHGVGLEVHETPRISQKSKDAIKPHEVFTVEPGVYYFGKFGMRIEDTVYVGRDGKANILTNYSKDLEVIT